MKNKVDQVTKNYVEWAVKQNIASGLSMHSQFVKLTEEAKEIAEGAKELYTALKDNDKEKLKKACDMIKDGIGDTVVVASILAKQYQLKDAVGSELVSSKFFALANVEKDPVVASVLSGKIDTDANHAYFIATPMNMLTSNLLINLGAVASDVARGHNPVGSLKLLCANVEVIASFLQFDLLECLEMAWNEIKDRVGLVVDGVFIKESDLTEEQKALFNNQK